MMLQILILLSCYYNNLIIKNIPNNYRSGLKKSNHFIMIQDNPIIKNINFDPILILNHKTNVYIHIEKLYTRMPIYHIGISFFNGYRSVRYDYRPFNQNDSYITINKKENDTFKNNIVQSKTIYWCQIDYNLNYIDNCEKYIVNTYPRYKLGINDCRHYAHRLTMKTTTNPTPIWNLHKLWNSIK